LPGSRTCSNAALLSSTQLAEAEVTVTVIDLLLSEVDDLQPGADRCSSAA